MGKSDHILAPAALHLGIAQCLLSRMLVRPTALQDTSENIQTSCSCPDVLLQNSGTRNQIDVGISVRHTEDGGL